MRRIIGTASATLVAASASLIVAVPAHAATPQVCVFDVDTHRTTCSTVASLATFVAGLPATIPTYGPTGAQRDSMSSNPANKNILGVVFQNSNYTGNVLVFKSTDPRYYCSSMSSAPATVNLNQVDSLIPAPLFHYDNAVNAEFALNGCSVGGAADPDYRGFSAGLQTVDYHPAGTELNHQITAIRFAHTPTPNEALKACTKGTATCKATATGVTHQNGQATQVDRVGNCSGLTQSKIDTWTHTYTSTSTVGGSVQSDTAVEAEVKDWLKVSQKISIQANWSNSYAEARWYASSIPISIADGTYAYVFNTPQMDVFSGYEEVWINSTSAYTKVPWSWTQVAAPIDINGQTMGATGTTIFSARTMTPAEYADCKALPQE